MHIRLLLAILLAGLTVQAQPETDSLRRKLVRMESLRPDFVQDTLRFHLLIKLINQTKNWEQIRNYWQEAIDLAEKNNWASGRLDGYQGMGFHYREKGYFLEAASYFQQGLHLAETNKNYRYQVNCYQSLGLAYSVAGETDKSLEAYQSALKLAKKLDPKRYLICLNEIGEVYFHAKKYPQALFYYQQCIKRNLPVDSTKQCWFLINIAISFQETGRYEVALKNYKKLFQYGKFLKKEDSILTYAKLGQLYVKLGKPDLGLSYGLLASRIALHSQTYYSNSLINNTFAEAYKAKGDWKKAFMYERRFHLYNDSLVSQRQRRELQDIKVFYENEKSRAELDFMKDQMKTKELANNLLWFGMITFGLLGGVLILFNYLLRKRRRKIEFQKNEISKINNSLELRVEERTAALKLANTELIRKNKEIEQALLRGQTLERKRVASELHDSLGGTLAAIQWYMESLLLSNKANKLQPEGYDDLYHMVSRAYGEVRLLAHHMMPEVLEKEGLEVALQEIAIPINKSGRLHLTVDTKEVSPYLNSQQKFELYSIALELFTNILKHAKASKAYLVLDRENQEIIMSVTDNGIGMPVNRQNQNMGLKNIQSRLETIGGYCTVQSEQGQGTIVLIKIPYLDLQTELVETNDHEPLNN